MTSLFLVVKASMIFDMHSAINSNWSSLNPLVVPAAVPTLIPDVTKVIVYQMELSFVTCNSTSI